VGDENIFIFGLTAGEAAALRARGYNPWDIYNSHAELRQTLDMIGGGFFSPDEPGRFRPVFDALTGYGDRFLLLADYEAYMACQDRVDALYRDPEEWSRKAILNVAGMGKFSSDRTIFEYAERIWGVKSMPER
jgi:starch phosphorylase